MSISSSQLNQTQLEILKLFSRDLSEGDLLDLKRTIVRFLAEKATKMIDEIIDEKGLSINDIDAIAQTHLRTPYN
jgi:tRNA A37 threonylcarbamoyladenosine modification protein TsaB